MKAEHPLLAEMNKILGKSLQILKDGGHDVDVAWQQSHLLEREQMGAYHMALDVLMKFAKRPKNSEFSDRVKAENFQRIFEDLEYWAATMALMYASRAIDVIKAGDDSQWHFIVLAQKFSREINWVLKRNAEIKRPNKARKSKDKGGNTDWYEPAYARYLQLLNDGLAKGDARDKVMSEFERGKSVFYEMKNEMEKK